MTTQSIHEQSKFVLNGKRCEVLNIYRADNELRYREFIDDQDPYAFNTKLLKLSELQGFVQSGEAKVEDVRKRSNEMYLSNEQLETMDYRLKFVLQCFKASPNAPTSKRAVEEAIKIVAWQENDKKPPGVSTIQGWVKKYRDSGRSKHALLDNFILVKQSRRRFPIEIEEAFSDCIANYYLVTNPRSYDYIFSKFEQICIQILADNKGDPAYEKEIPCKSTMINRIRAFTDEEALIAKHGKIKARQQIRAKLKAFKVSTILERCEMDGLHIHLGIVDSADNTKYLGSLVLMCVIDVYSRVILGYSIYLTDKKGEPTDLIVQCLKHIFSLTRDKRWPIVYSIPNLVTDTSSAATGDQWQQIQHVHNITVTFTTSNTPQEKPFIESFNNTLRRTFLKFLFGYFGREKFRGDSIKMHEDVKTQACMTLEGFIAEFEYFIHEVYHKKSHSGLSGRAPIDVWNEEMGKMPEHYKHSVKISSGAEMYGCTCERKYSKKENGFFVDGRWYKDTGLYKWLVTSSDGQIGYPEKDVLNNVKLLHSGIDVRSITAVHPKTKAMRSIPLWNADKLNLNLDEPLQREQYLALLEAPYRKIDVAEKVHYEPSEATRLQAQSILQRKQTIKKSAKANQPPKPQHSEVGSQEFKKKVYQHVKNNVPDNVVININSQPDTGADDTPEDWEADINLDDIGG